MCIGFLWLPQQSSTNWVYSLTVLEIEVPSPDVDKVSAGIEEGIKEESGGCWESLTFLGLLSSHAILTFYLYPDRKKNISHWVRAYTNLARPDFNMIMLMKTLFPNKVTF